MNLFELTTSNKLNIHPEAYALMPFRRVWERSKDKGTSEKELAYVYYMVDYKSPFSSILNDADRHREVCGALELKETWQPDDLVREAAKFYDKIQETVSLRFLRSSLRAVNEMQEYFNTFERDERNDRGAYVNQPKDIMTMLKQCGDVMQQIKKLEEEVRKEQATSTLARGGKEIGMLEQ